MARDRRLAGVRLALSLVAAALAVGCDVGPPSREVALRATVEALRDELGQARASSSALAAPAATAAAPVEGGEAGGLPNNLQKEWWVANHRATALWSASSGGKVVALVPQWTYLLVMEAQVGSRLHLFLPGGQRNSYAGDGWVEASDVGPVGKPPAGAIDASMVPLERAPSVPTVVPRATPAAGPDSRLLDWRAVNEKTGVGDLELSVNALLRGQASYGGPYGARIAAAPGTKIVLADLTLGYGFRPGVPPTEVHVDFFVIGDADGTEYRGLPVPMGNALPDRFFLSPGQGFTGVVAFIVPQDLESGRVYFTNFLGRRDPQERLTVYLREIP